MENYIDIVQAEGINPKLVKEYKHHYTKDGELVLEIRVQNEDLECPNCHSKFKTIKEYRQSEIRGLKVGLHPCKIKVKYPKYHCKECGRYFSMDTSPLSYYKITKDCFKSIDEDFKKMKTFTDIALDHHIPRSTVIKIFDETIPDISADIGEAISFDEFKNLSTAPDMFAFVVIDFNTKKIIKIINTRKKDALERYFESIPREKRKKVKYVTCDMYQLYINLAHKYFPNAKVAVDPFHYIRYVSEALNRIRIRVTNRDNLPSLLAWLNQHKRLLLMSFENIRKLQVDKQYKYDLEEKILKACELNGELHVAYQDYQVFLADFHKADSVRKGKSAVRNLMNYLENSFIPEYREVGKTWRHFEQYIMNSFIVYKGHRLTNGAMEGTNSRIKTLKKLCSGFKSSDRFFKKIIYIISNNK